MHPPYFNDFVGGGLVEDARTRTLNEKTRNTLDAMAKRLGLQVEFVDEVRTSEGTRANADIVCNKVRIAWANRDQALDFLLGHEFTHRMQDLSPEAYAEFVESAKQALGEAWGKRIKRMQDLYKQHGLSVSEQTIVDEVVADYAGELVANRGVFDNFVERNKDNRSLLSRIADVLRSIKEFFSTGKQRKINNAIARLEALIESASEANLQGDVVNMEQERYSVSEVNERFNEELQQQIDGTLPVGHVYELGMPSGILLSTGIADSPIQLSSTKLLDKSSNFGHDYELHEIKDLVKAINKPIAIFAYGDKSKAQNIIVEIQHEDKNFIVGLSILPKVNGQVLEINSIRNVFPKDNAEWLNWGSVAKRCGNK